MIGDEDVSLWTLISLRQRDIDEIDVYANMKITLFVKYNRSKGESWSHGPEYRRITSKDIKEQTLKKSVLDD